MNHVTKRMGTNLGKLVKDMKGKKLEDGKGISGKGRLTIARIDAMQNLYGRTIRDKKGDSAKMLITPSMKIVRKVNEVGAVINATLRLVQKHTSQQNHHSVQRS